MRRILSLSFVEDPLELPPEKKNKIEYEGG